MLWFALAYASVVAIAAAWAVVELWAKSYDFPGWQRLAWVSEMAVFGATGYVLSELAMWIAARPLTAARVPEWIAFLPPAAVLLLGAHDLDWRHVYVAAIGGCLAPVLGAAGVGGAMAAMPCVLLLVLLSMMVNRERSGVRLRRYTSNLNSLCSCCGYKQKAVHELWSLGGVGENVVRTYAEEHSESRVAEELARCRPTTS